MASQDFSLVMRYNQRGVGRSKGRRFSFKNLRGEQDAADVTHMIEFLSQKLTSPDSKSVQVIVIGYSFGACLASYALQDPRVALYIGISFPLGGVSSLLKTKQAFDLLCKAAHVPRLLVLGAQDQYTKVDAMEGAMKIGGGVRILEGEKRETSLAGSPSAVVGVAENEHLAQKPLLLKIFSENSHFWETDLALMVEYCIGWIENQL